jgi:hypothetical protein
MMMKAMKVTTMVFILMDRMMLRQREAMMQTADQRHLAAKATAWWTRRSQWFAVLPDICIV